MSSPATAAIVLDALSSLNIHVAFIQESWHQGDQISARPSLIPTGEWRCLFSDQPFDEQTKGRGLIIMVSATLSSLAQFSLRFVSESRTPAFDLLVASYGPFLLINVYIHTSQPRSVATGLSEVLGTMAARYPHLIPIIAGDFNLPTNNDFLSQELESACGVIPLLETGHTTRGRNLLDNIYYPSSHNVSLHSISTQGTSDHQLVAALVELPRPQLSAAPNLQPSLGRQVCWNRLDRIMTDPEAADRLIHDVTMASQGNTCISQMRDRLLQVAELHLGTFNPRDGKKRHPAMTLAVISALDEFNRIRRRYGGSLRHEPVRAAQRRFRKLFRKSCKKQRRDLTTKIKSGEISLLYAIFQRHKDRACPLEDTSPYCRPTEFLNFWRQQFTSEGSETALDAALLYLGDIAIAPEISIASEDVSKVIQAASHSSAGPDGMSIRYIKRFENIIAPALLQLMEAASYDLEPTMKSGRTILLPKTHPPSQDPGKSRPITVYNHLSRIVLKAIERRLRSDLERAERYPIGVEQAGFTKGRSPLEQVFLLHFFTDWHRSRNKPLFAAFLDIEKAFDSLHHGAFMEVLQDLGISLQWQKVIGHLLKGNSTTLYGERIDISQGTIQGGAPSPLFFIIFLEDLVRCLKRRASASQGIKMPWSTRHLIIQLLILLFADDLTLFDVTMEGLQSLLDFSNEWADRRFLRFSASKSFAMHLAGPLQIPLAQLRLGTGHIGWRDVGTYLGVPIYANIKRRSDDTAYPFKERQISNVIFSIKRLLMRRRSPIDLDISLLRQCITSSILPLANYPTSILDIDYDALDVRINELFREALSLPYETHIAFIRSELGLWPAMYTAHYTALRFIWRIRHLYWTKDAWRTWRAGSGFPMSQLVNSVTILRRYSRILKLYGLSWEFLASTKIFEDWCGISRRNIEAAIISWLRQEGRRIDMPSILRSSQVTSLRLSSTLPLPPHYSLEARSARIAANFRSDRVRYLFHRPPSEAMCHWCRSYGKENGRHFLQCECKPDELIDKINDTKLFFRNAGIPADKVDSFVMLDWTPDPPPLDMIRQAIDLQRIILLEYRNRHIGDRPIGPTGFPDL